MRKPTIRELALRRSEFQALALRQIRFDERLTLETSVFESLYGGPIHLVSPVDKTRLSCNMLYRK